LGVNVELRFRDLNEVMLRSVPKSVDHLKNKSLLLVDEPDGSIAECPAHAIVETYSLLSATIADSSPTVKNSSLQEHLERVVEKDEDGIYPTTIPRAIEVLNAEN
jgi:hypothetical protein